MKKSSPSSLMDSIRLPTINPIFPGHTIASVQVRAIPTLAQSRTRHIVLPQRHFLFTILNTLKLCLIVAITLSAGVIFMFSRTHHIFTIMSGSMAPAIGTGAVVAIPQQTITQSYQPSNIVTFHSSRGLITHRIIEVVTTNSAEKYRTQGDANPLPDHDLLNHEDIVGPVRVTVPLLGYLVTWLKTKVGFAVLILLPATGIIMQELRSMRAAWQQLHLSPRIMTQTTFALIMTAIITPGLTYAAFSTQTAAFNNNITTATLFPSPTPSPTPAPSPNASPTPTPSSSPLPSPTPDIAGDCDLDVNLDLENTNTGPDSTNENNVTINHDCTVTENNDTTSTNDINIHANTGNNSQTNNTDTGSQSSGDITIDINLNN